MSPRNSDIANAFYRMAELLEIEGANPFRVRAYRRAGAVIEDLSEPVSDMLARGVDLDEALPGVGADLAGKIQEICETGRLAALEAVEARTPPQLADLTTIPGLGPRRIRLLHDRLGVTSTRDLLTACEEGRVGGLPRFGRSLEARILAFLRKTQGAVKPGQPRWRISVADEIARSLVAWIGAAPGVGRVEAAGSLRRRKETVGDLDLLVVSEAGEAVSDRLTRYEGVERVVAKGRARATVVLRDGLQIDLRVTPDESWGAALVYFTGSKSHNIALRRRAQARGLKINEYGVFRGEDRIAGRTEAEVYASVGLPWIPPELREDRGEIDAACGEGLPGLVELKDVRGDFHVHTTASDGRNTLAEMAEAARVLGYAYVAISDHSRHAAVAHGLDANRLAAQIDEIDRLNAADPGIQVLKSCEADILANGDLDLPTDLLERLDIVTGAIHSDFSLSRAAQTDRVLRAMDHPHFHILAHPTGRLLEERPGYDVDLPKIFAAARQRGCFMEINGHPRRLDLDDVQARAASEMGVRTVIGSDAHSAADLAHMRHGVDQARRGWLEVGDVANTLPWLQVKRLLAG